MLRGHFEASFQLSKHQAAGGLLCAAIAYYYGNHADMSRIMCMVTVEGADAKQSTAGHIYRQGWQTGYW